MGDKIKSWAHIHKRVFSEVGTSIHKIVTLNTLQIFMIYMKITIEAFIIRDKSSIFIEGILGMTTLNRMKVVQFDDI